ncbi:endopeptidase La [Pseudomonadota bacterium]
MMPRKTFCTIPLRDAIVFPRIHASLMVGRKKSIKALEKAMETNDLLFIIVQKDEKKIDVNQKNLYTVGVLCNIIHSSKLPDGSYKVTVEGISSAKLNKFSDKDEYYYSEVEHVKIPRYNKTKTDALKKLLLKKFKEYVSLNKQIPIEILPSIESLKTVDELVYYTSTFLALKTPQRQSLLEESSPYHKLKKVYEFLEVEIGLLQTEHKISDSINKKFLKHQKKIFLNEQLKHIKKELGEDINEEDDNSEISELKKKIKQLKLPQEIREKCESEIGKLEKMFTGSSEATVIRNYLDWIVSLPWNKKTKTSNDIKKAQRILDRDHYGVEKIKERIIEFLSVYKKTSKLKGPIICFYGPPGVGKTSLVKSIAEALNRKYVKVSLGGVRDESEIRGHRKTYIGSMPGRIIQSIKKAGYSNPLMLLDEVEKMSSDYRGDPSSAMLEVLDPEQNRHFNDHYLEVDYDLSDVMFIATANNARDILPPLRDRMELINLSGYTEDEKLEIAKRHLIRKQRKLHGLKQKEFVINDKAILKIIRNYTFEAGVRNLERELANIIRKVTKKIVSGEVSKVSVKESDVKKYLGVEKSKYQEVSKENQIGVTTGLAYTDFGGDLLSIEALKFEGSGKLNITGKLGEVMQESVQAAFSYVRSKASIFGINAKEFNKYDFHVHVPEGATPKDGPSAGIAICGALMSVISGAPVKKDVAMTGEITLTGKVLPIGGLKEKLLAALRGGIKTVIIPKENEKNLEDLPKKVVNKLNIKPVERVEDALKIMLVSYYKAKKSSKPSKKGEK